MLPAGIIPDLSREKRSGGGALVVFQEPPEPFATLHRTLTHCVLADRRKEQDVALALVIALVMKVLHIERQCMAKHRFPTQDPTRQTLLLGQAHPAFRTRRQDGTSEAHGDA